VQCHAAAWQMIQTEGQIESSSQSNDGSHCQFVGLQKQATMTMWEVEKKITVEWLKQLRLPGVGCQLIAEKGC
jgi:hypothetical protein